MAETCPDCGLGYVPGVNDEVHKEFHDRVINGFTTDLPDGFHPITNNSPMPLQRVAESAAQAAHDDNTYDFAAFAASEDLDEYNTVVLVWVYERRVCGFIASRERLCCRRTRLDSFRQGFDGWRPNAMEETPDEQRRNIDMIWIIRKHRRQGYARTLVQELARHCRMGVEEFGHMLPFTESALLFWQTFSFITIYVV